MSRRKAGLEPDFMREYQDLNLRVYALERYVSNENPWVTPSLPSGWLADIDYEAQYRLKEGVVYLRGRLSTLGSSGSVIFTLPEGMRPDRDMRLVASTGASTYPCALVVEADGDVRPYYSAGSTITLDGVSFIADQ